MNLNEQVCRVTTEPCLLTGCKVIKVMQNSGSCSCKEVAVLMECILSIRIRCLAAHLR